MFALCFLLSRVVFMLMIQIRNIQAHYIFDITLQADVLFWMQIATDVLLGMLYLLQLYWFKAILMVMVKAATGSGDYKKQEGPQKEAKAE
jgi:hypothetical protein